MKLLDGVIIGMLCVLGSLVFNTWRRSPATDERASRASIARIERSIPGGFPSWLQSHVRTQQWANPSGAHAKLERKVVDESIRLCRAYLLHNQKPAGNFNYSYDFVAGKLNNLDQQVRQAGALWVLALLARHQPDLEVLSALDKALDFFLTYTRPSETEGAVAIAYPGDSICQSGTVALAALAVIERLDSAPGGTPPIEPKRQQQLETALAGYLRHLEFMRLENHHFSSAWSWSKNSRSSSWDPYSDGESLLCLVKAAKNRKILRLVPQVESSVAHLVRHYTAGQWRRNSNSALTEGFFQWGCMALWEYRDTGWVEAQMADDYLLTMGWWLTREHRVLDLPGNTASSFEGLILCWLAAKQTRNVKATAELGWTIDQGLTKLIGWQIAGPLNPQNAFLKAHPTTDPLAVGGVLTMPNDPILQIDITLHQLHALLLARQYLFNSETAL